VLCPGASPTLPGQNAEKIEAIEGHPKASREFHHEFIRVIAVQAQIFRQSGACADCRFWNSSLFRGKANDRFSVCASCSASAFIQQFRCPP
jgi:hypothetical protein